MPTGRYNLQDIVWESSFILQGEALQEGQNLKGLKFDLFAHQILYQHPEEYQSFGDYYIGINLFIEPNNKFVEPDKGYQTDKILCISTQAVKKNEHDLGVVFIFKPDNNKSGVVLNNPGSEQVFKLSSGIPDKIELYYSDLKGNSIKQELGFNFGECCLQVLVCKTKRKILLFGQ